MAKGFSTLAQRWFAGLPTRHRPAQTDDSKAAMSDVAACDFIMDRVLPDEVERQRFERSRSQYAASGVTDYFLTSHARDCDPDQMFDRLRWGGQLLFYSPHQQKVEQLFERYRGRPEYAIDVAPQPVPEVKTRQRRSTRPWSRALGRGARNADAQTFFIVRKIVLVPPGRINDRHSYDVRLVRSPTAMSDDYVVLKQVPTFDQTAHRLTQRFPDADSDAIERSARKLVQKVFPIFLSREAALLTIIARDLPPEYADRFPRVLAMEKDERGLVRTLHLNWLRLGGDTISQLEFARQSAQLLHLLHEQIGIIHLDLRLDNFVVTQRGVGFVDFGSAVRVGEDFTGNPMLSSLFGEMLSSSQIQKDLRRLVRKKKVTSNLFVECGRKMDKAIDLFYLVLQMNNPHANPDFRGLVHYDRDDVHAQALSRLSRSVFKPSDPGRLRYRTAGDVLRAIDWIHDRLRS